MTRRRLVIRLGTADGEWTVQVGRAPSRRLPTVTTRLGALPSAGHDVDDVVGLLGRLDRNQLAAGEPARLGRYLYDCLVDDDLRAALTSAGGLHLVLATERGSDQPHRMPWELLHDGHGFLAVRPTPSVTISRAVGAPDASPTRVQVEPRVLVVVGGTVDQHDLQPAAEYLALLDTLRQGALGINVSLVVEAGAAEIRAACAAVRPDVVHVIAHGDQNAGGKGFVELAPAPPADGPQQVYATQLLGMLGGPDRPLPRVLIVTACRSGSVGVTAGAPWEPFTFQPSLAAECVAGGVPIALAMTGRITSTACREFTLGFYGTLLTGGDVVAAADEGRRSAFVDAGPAADAVEWAYPALFCGPGVDGHVEITGGARLAARTRRARELLDRFRSPVAFCGRQDVLHALRRLLSASGVDAPAVLALDVPKNVPDKVGASRALAQLGAAATLAGWAVATPRRRPGDDEALTFRALAGRLAVAACDAARGLGATVPDPLQLALLKQPGMPGLDPGLSTRLGLEEFDAGSDEAVFQALQLDLVTIRRAVLAAPDAEGGLLVLLDDLDRCGAAVKPFLEQSVTSGYGLGTAGDPIPLAFCYRDGDDVDGSDARARIVKFVTDKRAASLPIRPFTPPVSELAYQQLLLGSRPPLIPREEDRTAIFGFLHEQTQGYPGGFSRLDLVIGAYRSIGGLQPATDPQRLAAMVGEGS